MKLKLKKQSMCGMVSVIIPTYNGGKFICHAIDSVLNQTYNNYEIIVIDDGSTDNTKKVIREYNSKIKYIYHDNKGLSFSRNVGLTEAEGEYIVMLDADDILDRNYLETQLMNLNREHGCEIVVCRNKIFFKLDRTGAPKVKKIWRLFKNDYDIHIYYRNIAPPHAFMFRINLVREIGGFDESLRACEDYDFWFRAISRKKVNYNPLSKVYYRKHSKSMSADKKNQLTHDIIIYKRIVAILTNQEINQIREKALALCAGILEALSSAFQNGVECGEIVKSAKNLLNRYYEKVNYKDVITNPIARLYYLKIKLLLHFDQNLKEKIFQNKIAKLNNRKRNNEQIIVLRILQEIIKNILLRKNKNMLVDWISLKTIISYFIIAARSNSKTKISHS